MTGSELPMLFHMVSQREMLDLCHKYNSSNYNQQQQHDFASGAIVIAR